MGAGFPSTAAYTKKIEYTLDDNGNRSSVKVTPYGQSATTTSYTDNNLNQYTDVGGTTHSYDANGNLTDDGQLTYEYNFRNLLCRVKDGATVVASYQHDALGRRVKTIIGSACKRYIYSGAETIAVYDESNALLQEFVYGQVIDEVLMLEQADVLDADGDSNTTELARSFYHRNALGSVMEITEMDEDVAVSYRYDPYGAVTITRNGSTQSSDPLGQPITYTGRWSDEETGLMYYRARMYSARMGRFLQRDPLGVSAGPSLYEYARSAPAVYVDPLGEHIDRPGPWNGPGGERGPYDPDSDGGAEDAPKDDDAPRDEEPAPAGVAIPAVPFPEFDKWLDVRKAKGVGVFAKAAARASFLVWICTWSGKPEGVCGCTVVITYATKPLPHPDAEVKQVTHTFSGGSCVDDSQCEEQCEGLWEAYTLINPMPPALKGAAVEITGKCLL